MHDLLETLAMYACCPYLSDLPRLWRNQLHSGDVCQIPCEQYAVKEWNEALHYIFREEQHFCSAEEAKDALIARLTH